jgi:hypothetical protein
MSNFITKPRHLLPHGGEVIAGLLLFVIGSWFLYQAYDGRGKDQPHILRPFSFW